MKYLAAVLAITACFACDALRVYTPETYRERFLTKCEILDRAPEKPSTPSVEPDARVALSKEEITAAITERIDEVRWCYERGMQAWPKLTGRVSIKFEITPDGHVRGAAVLGYQDTTGQPAVGCCIAQKMSHWTFSPPGGGGVAVEYPFVLQQQE